MHPGLLGLCLVAYAGLLWAAPAAFLVVLPVVLPVFDFGLWTGWVMLGEADLFVLLTVAVLLVRSPLDWRDAVPSPVMGAFAAIWLVSTVTGLLSPLGGAASDNAFLRPDNALRMAKGLIEALALMPFIAARQRTHHDATTLFATGMAAGLVGVTLVVLAERLLFSGVLDFSGEYRVAGPFSSMRVGGGHIGAYAAMALPFTLYVARMRKAWLGVLLFTVSGTAGAYTLAVTFARTAYAAGVAGLVVAALGGLRTGAGQATRRLVPIVLVAGALAGVAAFTGMQARFAASQTDFSTRAGNWRAGLAVRNTDLGSTLWGMGLGTYQRAMLARSAVNKPSDIALRRYDDATVVAIRSETPFFLGQKIAVPADSVQVTLRARALDGPNTVNVSLCDKVLLYSDNCQFARMELAVPGAWAEMSASLPSAALGSGTLAGWLKRPVELSVFAQRDRIEISNVSATDRSGRQLLANGDFSRGLDRWVFTDDSHVAWRMLNEYLMLFFETGAIGVIAYLILAGSAMVGALRASAGPAAAGSAIAGGVAAFLVSGLFDNVLEAPRIATLFFLLCICGMLPRAGGPLVPAAVAHTV